MTTISPFSFFSGMGNGLSIIVAWLFLLWAGHAQGESSSSKEVAFCGTFELAALPGITVESEGFAQAGPGGHLVGWATLSGTGVNTDNDFAVLYRPPGGPVELLIREGDSLAAIGGPAGMLFGRLDHATIAADGKVAMTVRTSLGFDAIVIGVPGALQVVAFEGEDLSAEFGSGASLLSLQGDPILTPGGDLYFRVRVTGGPPSLFNAILTFPASGGRSVLLAEGVNYAGMPVAPDPFDEGEVSVFSAGTLGIRTMANPDGELLFTATIDDGPGGIDPADGNGIWRFSGGVVSEVARVGTAAPDVSGAVFDRLALSSTAAGGWGIFSGRMESGVGGVSGGDDEATWVIAGGIAQLILREGQAAPGLSGKNFVQFRSFGGLADVGIADNGRVLVRAETADGEGLWTWQGGTLSLLASAGGAVEGVAGATWTDFPYAAIAPDGRVWFSGRYDDGGTNCRGVWSDDGSGNLQAMVLHGDIATLPGGGSVTADDPRLGGTANISGWLSNGGSEGWATMFGRPGEALVDFDGVCQVIVSDAVPPEFELTMRRLSNSQGAANWYSDDVDDPLIPESNPFDLILQEEIDAGLVTDGVSPLIFDLRVPPTDGVTTLRWTCEVEAHGEVTGGIYPRLFFQPEEGSEWEPAVASDGGSENDLTITDSEVSSAFFFYLSALQPDEINAAEIEGTFRVFDPDNPGTTLVSLDFKIRRPPLYLIANDPPSPWGSPFTAVLGQSRPSGWILPLGEGVRASLTRPLPMADIPEEILEALGWQDAPTEFADWAIQRVDVIAHGNGGLALRRLGGTRGNQSLDVPFRNETNAFRGRFRRGVTIGTPHLYRFGVIQSYAGYLDAVTRDLELGGNIFSFLPEHMAAIHRELKFGDTGREFTIGDNRLNEARDARLHLLTSVIDPTQAPALDLLLLTPQRLQLLAPSGSDGAVEVENALGGAPDATFSSLLGEGNPAQQASHYLGSKFFGAVEQTLSPHIAQRAIDVLDGGGDIEFIPVAELLPFSDPHFLELANYRAGLIKAVAGDALRQQLDTLVDAFTELQQVIDPPSGSGGGGAPNAPPSQEFVFEIAELPDAPLVGQPTFIAEVFGPDGATTTGVTVAVEPGNPRQVRVTIAAGVVGDVVLYASYEASNVGLIFAEPIVVASSEPDGATLTGIELDPATLTLEVDERARPVVMATYSNGMRLRRWIEADDITVTSTAPGVVDVGDELNWRALAPGQATVAVNYAGMSAQSDITVVEPYPVSDYAAWKAQFFSAAELADPGVSGDEVDGEGDGIGIFWEYLTGGSPLFHDPGPFPRFVPIPVVGGEDHVGLLVRFSTQLPGGGEPLAVQISDDLENWARYYLFDGSPEESEPGIHRVTDYGPFFEVVFDLSESGDASDVLKFFRLIYGDTGGAAAGPGP